MSVEPNSAEVKKKTVSQRIKQQQTSPARQPCGSDQGCLGVFKCLCGLPPLSVQLGQREGQSHYHPLKTNFLVCFVWQVFCVSLSDFSLSENICLSGCFFFPLHWVAKAMFVCLNSETVIDIDEVLLLLADHYTACICWVPLHIIMMWNLLVRVSVNSVIDFTVLTFYSITSEIGPSLHVGNLLIFKTAWA